MRVLIASKILVLAAYRRKLEALAAQPEIERLVAVVPPAWAGLAFEDGRPLGYDLRVEPIRFGVSFHLFYWPTLGRVLRQERPDLVHLDEEPYNLATFLGTADASRAGSRSVFFAWQNLLRRYPPPFSLFERYVFRRSAHAIAGSQAAAQVLRAKGFRGPTTVVPQFGIDPDLFAPGPARPAASQPTIGFVARLVEEKGVWVLLEALAGLRELAWRLHVLGSGPLAEPARRWAEGHGLADRVTWEAGVASTRVPDRLRTFDVLVQPSLTRRHWKEQFGRALMEAMACGVAVVGSDSGEIANVVGEAGLIVPEGDPLALRAALACLLSDADRRAEYGRRGRARALARYTHARIAEQTVAVYRAVLVPPSPSGSGCPQGG